MFGYVRSREDTLSPEDQKLYEEAYCGLCHVLGERYGTYSRAFLNYDFVFLAMLLAPQDGMVTAECVKCVRHPWKGKRVCTKRAWMETAAGESVILSWWKLQDAIADGGALERLGAHMLSLGLRRSYRRARAEYPGFDEIADRLLAELRILEGERSSSIDRTADCFARLLCSAAPVDGEERLDRPRKQLLYHLGRWIYLIDAVDDLPRDKKAGRYNPVAARFLGWGKEEQTYLRQLMDHSLALVGAAFQLLPRTPWSGVLENIIYSGLPGVEELVFSGQWGEYQKKHRRNDL